MCTFSSKNSPILKKSYQDKYLYKNKMFLMFGVYTRSNRVLYSIVRVILEKNIDEKSKNDSTKEQ